MRAAISKRLKRLRHEPLEALVFDLEWIGARLIRALGGGTEAVGRWRALLYRGRAVECPCCGGRFRRFLPDALGHPDVVCPRCFSHNRHRALWLYLERRDLPRAILHLAPEPSLQRLLRDHPGYTTADLDSPLADVHADVTALPFADEQFDLVLCSHVLEHVNDDAAAMRELRRILKPDGTAIFLVPVDVTREATLEDPAVATPAQRKAVYWQEDHVRLYGRDFPDRLAAAGFDVTVDEFVKALDERTVARHGLNRADDFFVARRGA